jgi:hypothetical protein
MPASVREVTMGRRWIYCRGLWSTGPVCVGRYTWKAAGRETATLSRICESRATEIDPRGGRKWPFVRRETQK